MKKLILLALTALSIASPPLATGAAAYGEYLDLKALKAQVRDFTLGHYKKRFPDYDIEAQVTQLDSRTKLKTCAEPLAFKPPKILNRSGNSLISVRCSAQTPWRIFVPVKVSVFRDVLVASGPIARNGTVNASNTTIKRISMTSFRDEYVTELSDVSGMIARRNVRDGQAIMLSHLTTPTLVKRGDVVVISASTGATQVKIAGIAQAAGRKGEQISVKNSHSNRVLKAVVTGRGRVAVML